MSKNSLTLSSSATYGFNNCESSTILLHGLIWPSKAAPQEPFSLLAAVELSPVTFE